jgi:hypothetical protein
MRGDEMTTAATKKKRPTNPILGRKVKRATKTNPRRTTTIRQLREEIKGLQTLLQKALRRNRRLDKSLRSSNKTNRDLCLLYKQAREWDFESSQMLDRVAELLSCTGELMIDKFGDHWAWRFKGMHSWAGPYVNAKTALKEAMKQISARDKSKAKELSK